ncbi:uncharacterized protein LOC132637958 [Lycium barbarum]|uniref:uncharacterized protein LOC132637958 n=1 Tax=Lycium barbarum TaxID=112863 RepID=UPI00293F7575|nr:uncharacterized protein LOC132637958 [Lycium barbarum]
MAKAYTQNEFDMQMETVEKVDIHVKNYLEEVGREKWARLYTTVNRAWTMTSNIAESINSSLVDARELPIIEFLEEVRLLFGHWNCTNRQNGSYTSTTLGIKFNKMLSINKHKSVCMKVIPSTKYVHTVIVEGRRFIVCIEKKTCSCKEFQMEGIPCHMLGLSLRRKISNPTTIAQKYTNRTL